MAYVGLTNVSISQGGAADLLYATYAALTSASWVTLASGTGLAGGYSSSGSLITSAATFNSNGAWTRMREPGGVGGREYIFMRGDTGIKALIKYSRSDGFVSGSPGAAQAPHAGATGDGQVILGTAGDTTSVAAAQSAAFCGSTGYVQGIASNTATNGAYGFWSFQYAAATGVIGGILMSEGVAPGSTSNIDGDPSWRLSSTSVNFWSLAAPVVSYWNKYNLSGETYITLGSFAQNAFIAPNTITAYYIVGPTGAPLGQDPYGSKTGFYPMMVGKALSWPKGYTTGISQGTTLQNMLDVFNITSAEPRITVAIGTALAPSLIVVPWVPNIVPSV